jgi:hypothetical protein
LQIEDEQRQKDEIREQYNNSERRYAQLQQEKMEVHNNFETV